MAGSDSISFGLRVERQPRSFRFIHASDTHIDTSSVGRVRRFRALADSLDPALTLFAGDLIKDAMSQQEPRARGYFELFLAEMKLRDPATSRERLWLGLGVALMAIGAALALTSYLISHQTRDPGVLNDALTIGLAGITCAVLGGALFLRFSVGSFLRFWLARLIYEQKAQTDRLLEPDT